MCGLREQISIQASVALGQAKAGGTADLESIVQKLFPSSEKASEQFYIQRNPPSHSHTVGSASPLPYSGEPASPFQHQGGPTVATDFF